MQLVANQQLVKNRVRVGSGLPLRRHGRRLGGAALSTQLDPQLDRLADVGRSSPARPLLGRPDTASPLGARKRQEEQLGQAIRSLDDRYKLYAFLSSSLPDYILVSPAGAAHVIIVKPMAGQISCIKDKWTIARPRESPACSGPASATRPPTPRASSRSYRGCSPAGTGDVPTSALIVFTNPRPARGSKGAAPPMTRVKELKDVLRRMSGKGDQCRADSTSRVREVQRFRRSDAGGAQLALSRCQSCRA